MDDVIESARQDKDHEFPVSAPEAAHVELPTLDGQDTSSLHALSVAPASVDQPLHTYQNDSSTAGILEEFQGNVQLIEPSGLERSGTNSPKSSSADNLAADHGENIKMAVASTTTGFLALVGPNGPVAHDNIEIPCQETIHETDREIAFLLRQFSECAGKWMDIFDSGSYFASCVPVMARTNPYVRYAAVATAAKQLGRVKGSMPDLATIGSGQALETYYRASGEADWACRAAKYKDKATLLLLEALHKDPDVALSRNRRAAEHGLGAGCNDLLIGTVILSMLECLDESRAAWSSHLNEAIWLMDVNEDGITPTQQHRSKAWKAAFWNLARQDLLYAFINECQTRLDTENLQLWRDAGISLDAEGLIQPSSQNEGDIMGADMIGNAIIWLTSKIVNYIAAADGIYPYPGGDLSKRDSTGAAAESPIGVNQKTLLERWRELERELNVWHDGLPDTFRPSARLHPSQTFSDMSMNASFPEIWYSNPICASTMQLYHMARILLLINKPHESTAVKSTVTRRLNSYRTIEMEVRKQSYQIVGIALSRPEASVRIHQVQPLFVAGQCLTEERERKVIIELLKGVENDLGWETEYRVKGLLEDWEWAP